MKRFKIGFLSIIAILAMSFTVISNNGLLNKIAPKKLTYACQSSDYKSLFLVRTDGTPVTPNFHQRNDITPSLSSPCPGQIQFCAILDEENDVNIECNGGNKFCCAQIVTPSTPCPPEEPFEDYVTKVQVYCMQVN